MDTLFEHLLKYADSGKISFAMPGHKGGRGFSKEFCENLCRIDVTELSATENLYSPGSVIKEAQNFISKLYRSKKSYILTGGSSQGIHTMLHCAYKGGRLLVDRSCHRSVINFCVLSGMEPVFIDQKIDPDLGVPLPPEPYAVEEALKNSTGIDAVLITSPTYYGHIANIKEISEICHKRNIPLLADEAHGAHFAARGMPECAISCGADMAAQSAHKTLNALNQAAYLHVGSEIFNPDKVLKVLKMTGTSSPSYPIVASAQQAALELLSDSWKDLCDYIDSKYDMLKNTSLVFPKGVHDRSRIVFGFKNYNISGYDAEKILSSDFGIDIEMADHKNVVCIATVSNTKEEIDTLFSAVKKIADSAKMQKPPVYTPVPKPKSVLSPRSAFLGKEELLPLDKSSGRIAKTIITAYPPATPIVIYGEKISQSVLEYIKTLKSLGANIDGLSPDGRIAVVSEQEYGKH